MRLLSFIFLTVSIQAFAFPPPLANEFADARVHAARMIEAIQSEELIFTAEQGRADRAEVSVWWESFKRELAVDIMTSPHFVRDANPNGACGNTEHYLKAPIYLALADCQELKTLEDRAAFLVGESAHHFPRVKGKPKLIIGDEFADQIRLALRATWQKKRASMAPPQPFALDVLHPGLYKLAARGGRELAIGANRRVYLVGNHLSYGQIKVGFPFDGRFHFDRARELWVAQTTMNWTGRRLLQVGPARMMAPDYCAATISIYMKVREFGFNVTFAKPASIQPLDCEIGPLVQEHFAYRYFGAMHGL